MEKQRRKYLYVVTRLVGITPPDVKVGGVIVDVMRRSLSWEVTCKLGDTVTVLGTVYGHKVGPYSDELLSALVVNAAQTQPVQHTNDA